MKGCWMFENCVFRAIEALGGFIYIIFVKLYFIILFDKGVSDSKSYDNDRNIF